MRFALALLASVVASVSATSLLQSRQAAYPNCAIPCLASADFGTCAQTDLTCLCHSDGFISSTTQCIVGACQGDDLKNAEAAARSECAAVGVTLTSTPAAPTSSSTPPASASTPAVAPTSSATSPSPPSPSTTPSTTPPSSGARANSISVLAGAAAFGAAIFAL